MITTERRLRLPCDCCSHEVEAYAEPEMDGDVALAYWRYGHGAGDRRSLRYRLKLAWRMLAYGHGYADMAILSRENALRLADFLREVTRS